MPGTVQVGLSSEAIAFADVVVLAVPGASVVPIVAENLDHLRGKTIIDASNNMRGESRHALGYLRDQLPTATYTARSTRLGGRILIIPISGVSRRTSSTVEMKMQKTRSSS